jgi:hypothetical protein
MDKRGFARIEEPFASKDAGDNNFRVDETNGRGFEAKGLQTRPAAWPFQPRMDKRGFARIEEPFASKDAGDDNFQVDETNGWSCEAKGHHTRAVARPPRPQMDQRGCARIEKPLTSKGTGDHNLQVDGKNAWSCEGTGLQTWLVSRLSPLMRGATLQFRCARSVACFLRPTRAHSARHRATACRRGDRVASGMAHNTLRYPAAASCSLLADSLQVTGDG